MAVPKKKRYKQIVQSRRSLRNITLLQKNKISFTKYLNFFNSVQNVSDTTADFDFLTHNFSYSNLKNFRYNK
jgi:hypothetical protein